MTVLAVLATSLVTTLGLGAALSGAPRAVIPAPPAPTAGSAVWPLAPAPEVAADFDPPEQTWNAGHRGVDLLGGAGQQVLAAASGQVTFAGRLAGRGVVVVSHGELRTTYEPVAADVRTGDTVDAGTRIGILEAGAGHCVPRTCLHWGLLRGEEYLDPLSLLGRGPVRLLAPTGPDGVSG